MIFAVELKRGETGAGIFGIIVGVLCHGKELCLIILLKVDESSEIGFYYTILPLSLAVCLCVEGNG